MKLYCSIFFLFFFLVFGYGQEVPKSEVNASYEEFLKEAVKKERDTLIKQVYRKYECSEFLSGNIVFYHKNDKLRLIKHTYKQNWDVSLEYYYIENDTLRLFTTFTEIIRANTKYTEGERQSSFSMEKVLDVTENRTFLSQNHVVMCQDRQHMEVQSKWDQEFFNSISFKKADCITDIAEIHHKYRMLRKAEKLLRHYGGKKPNCIFHMW